MQGGTVAGQVRHLGKQNRQGGQKLLIPIISLLINVGGGGGLCWMIWQVRLLKKSDRQGRQKVLMPTVAESINVDGEGKSCWLAGQVRHLEKEIAEKARKCLFQQQMCHKHMQTMFDGMVGISREVKSCLFQQQMSHKLWVVGQMRYWKKVMAMSESAYSNNRSGNKCGWRLQLMLDGRLVETFRKGSAGRSETAYSNNR